MNDTKTNETVIHEGFTLPVTKETTLGRKGGAGKVFYTVDFGELLVTSEVVQADKSVKKVEDYSATGKNLLTFFRGFDAFRAFFQADFDKAMVSLQVTSPATGKTPKVLTDAEKLTALRAYVSTIDEITRQRSGKASEAKRLTKEMTEYAANPANMANPVEFATKLQAMAVKIAELNAQIDAEASAE